MQSTFKIIAISDTVIKTRFVFCTRNRLTIFSMDTIPTKITTWIAYSIIAYIHNYTPSGLSICNLIIFLGSHQCLVKLTELNIVSPKVKRGSRIPGLQEPHDCDIINHS